MGGRGDCNENEGRNPRDFGFVSRLRLLRHFPWCDPRTRYLNVGSLAECSASKLEAMRLRLGPPAFAHERDIQACSGSDDDRVSDQGLDLLVPAGDEMLLRRSSRSMFDPAPLDSQPAEIDGSP